MWDLCVGKRMDRVLYVCRTGKQRDVNSLVCVWRRHSVEYGESCVLDRKRVAMGSMYLRVEGRKWFIICV